MRSNSALLVFATLCLLGMPGLGMRDSRAQTFTEGSGTASPVEIPQYEWLDGLCLIELDSTDELSLRRARARIEAAGGQIAILSPPSTLLGWIPAELRAELIGQAMIRAIHDQPLPASELRVADGPTRIMRRYFNRVSSGEYQREMRARAEKAPLIDPAELVSDALLREPGDPWEIRDNLERNGFPPDQLEDQGLLRLEKGNSDTMAGTVAVSLFFVESDGTQSDPNLYDWTEAAVQEYIEGVNTGMAWWSSKARLHRDCWAAFLVRWFEPTDPRCSQWREMVRHPSGDVAAMVSDVMINFGYTGGNVFSKVDAFNTAQRVSYGADRSYSAFIAYNPIGAGDRLTDGRSAFAYLLGPYTFLLYRSFSWRPDQVFAHESGHIFGACDEYAEACGCQSMCTNGVANTNCENCAVSQACMMKANSFSLCPFTDGHVGWRFSPCAPPPLLPPTLTVLQPASAQVGMTVDITVQGGDFTWGAELDLGPDVVVNSTSFVDENTLLANVTIDGVAAPGFRAASVVNRDLQTAELADGFRVIPTSRHYVSSSGSATYPYTTPATAALTLPEALAAAGPGDSILVEQGSLPTSSLTVERSVHLIGGWDAGFVQPPATEARTSIALSTNILARADLALEGLEIYGGRGRAVYVPEEARLGGAIQVESAWLSIRNCEIHSSEAILATTLIGRGGAIHATNSTVEIFDSVLRDNQSYVGGAIYLEQSDASFERTVFRSNQANVPFIGGQRGGAVYALGCSTLSFVDTNFEANVANVDGGAAHLVDCAATSIRGGSFLVNESTAGQGGALSVLGGDVSVERVRLEGNQASSYGGGIAASGGTTISVRRSEFVDNVALLGGGTWAAGPEALIEHNLWLRNRANATAGALYLTTLGSGLVDGNTFDANVGAATILLVDVSLELRHNIVVGSTGTGVVCSASELLSIHHNLSWANAGGDYGSCEPGAGAVFADPLFVDPVIEDYHLGLHSPAIDAGDPTFVDLDGSRRDLGWYAAPDRPLDQPARPQGVSLNQLEDAWIVAWAPAGEADVAGYSVYGGDDADFIPTAANQLVFVEGAMTSANLGTQPQASWIKVAAVDTDGYASGHSDALPLDTGTAAEQPVRISRLDQNVPNPFNPSTTIRFALPRRAQISLAIYDVTGRRVRELLGGEVGEGEREIRWDGRDDQGHQLPSGIYFYRLQAPDFDQTRKMTLLK